ncbi:MAG: KAP family NTPase, partial [Prosthecobacter sp.]|nr:KAP family NTPase [Prosthecobacter sp.]
MKPYLIAWLRALLLASAIVALVIWGRSDLTTFTSWRDGKWNWLSSLPIPWATFALLIAALLIPRLLSGLLRLWQWNERRRLLPYLPVLTLPLLTLLAIIGLIAFSGTPHATATAWLGGIALWYLLFTQLKTTPVNAEPIRDSFQRSYFVDRLMENVFLKADTKLRRIAILGTWGSGKTVVLKLLRERLADSQEKNFRIAWVNPWTAKTPEEARALIAQGFEEALGNSFSQSSTPGYSPWSWITGLKTAMGFGVTFDFSRFLEGSAKATEKDFVEHINQRLAARNVTVILLVDDMERAEPEVIRRIFPVIDRLGAIEHCRFVFAIDPGRVAKAFEEDSRNGEETKGYLDKVFDLQFTLPNLRSQDIATWAKEDKRINPTDTPKLHAALGQLAADLPSNPREALHFINDAITKEIMFLSRYADNEHNYTGFFRVRMLELEGPGLANELESSSVVNEYNTAKYRNYTGIKTSEQETPEQALDKACIHLFEKYKVAELKQPRIKKIITAILDNNVKLDWALHHHMRLLIPTEVESEAIQARWEEHFGKESLLTSIQSIVPLHSYSDNVITGKELISRELTANEELRIKIEKS